MQIASAQFFKHIQHQNKTSLGHWQSQLNLQTFGNEIHKCRLVTVSTYDFQFHKCQSNSWHQDIQSMYQDWSMQNTELPQFDPVTHLLSSGKGSLRRRSPNLAPLIFHWNILKRYLFIVCYPPLFIDIDSPYLCLGFRKNTLHLVQVLLHRAF